MFLGGKLISRETQNDFACRLFIRQIHRRLFKAIVDEFGPVGGRKTLKQTISNEQVFVNFSFGFCFYSQ